jgi:hypothetical protein
MDGLAWFVVIVLSVCGLSLAAALGYLIGLDHGMNMPTVEATPSNLDCLDGVK